jgi:hypothetical protein
VPLFEHAGDSVPQHTSDPVADTVARDPLLPVHSSTLGAGQEIVGGWVSRTVTLLVQLPVLLEGSVAWHPRDVVPSGKALPDSGRQEGVSGPAHVSEALAENVAAALRDPVHSRVIAAGQVTAGALVSTTATVVSHDEAFCAPSCALQVTFVAPSANPDPEAGAQPSSVAAPQLSVACGPPKDTGVVAPAHSAGDGDAGQVIDGPVLSTTVTSPVQESVAQLRGDPTSRVTLVVPRPYGPAGSCARVRFGLAWSAAGATDAVA